MQFVEVELDPGESAVAEAGTLMYKDSAVRMETVFGDGSAALAAPSSSPISPRANASTWTPAAWWR